MTTTVRPTRFKELGYRQDAPDLWRFIDMQGESAIGPHYKSKAELLADLGEYAAEYGCEGAVRPNYLKNSRAYYMAVRTNPEGVEWFDTSTLNIEPRGCQVETDKTDKLIRDWAKLHPVVRITGITITERK